MISNNLILLTDSYKVSHYKQYPEGTTKVYSYFESRGGEYDEVVFFGLQYFIKEYLLKPVTQADLDEASAVLEGHLGPGIFNKKGWEYIVKNLGGKLPISIKAVPEGTVVDGKNVLMTVENTDPNCFWLTNYLETLLVQVWYGCTVATTSREMKKTIKNALDKSGDISGLPFKLHDFGFRGVSSVESAGVGGAAHLVNFMGTDTMAGLIVARKYYNEEIGGFSIPAAEHSTITSWGRENEERAYENMLNQYPKGLVAVVSDSYDIYNACQNLWGDSLRDKVLAREGTLVIRPDSGEPTQVLPTLLTILGEKFGYSTNAKGYKVLPDAVRLIQGDGIGPKTLGEILNTVMKYGWSADNLAFGSGGALLQQMNRDTLKFAFKCSSITVNGEERNVSKSPIDAPWKASKAGRLKLVQHRGWRDKGRTPWFETITSNDLFKSANGFENTADSLVEVYRDGELLVDYNFASIRERAKV